MSKKIINDGYSPAKKGYQPVRPTTQRPDVGVVTGGYQPPTTSEGGNPANKPPPKKP